MSLDAAPSDLLILGIVVLARLILPLFIPRYPLPAIFACLVLDGVDQTIFQSYTHLRLDGYQAYDKALDIYYLGIAYLAALRNWSNLFAFQVVRFLFYYRLAGVVLFELLGWRVLMFVFPNTFEYFFIWYELVQLWRDPLRLPRTTVASAAAAIWIVVKLPQEYWIHIARLDVTDIIKTAFLGALPETPWGHIFRAAPWIYAGGAALAVGFMIALARLAVRNVPTDNVRRVLGVRLYRREFSRDRLRLAQSVWARRVFDRDLLEKFVLVALVVIVFAQIMPGVEATPLQLALAVALVTVLNTGISHWLARHGVGWKSVIGQFIVMAAANFTAVLLLLMMSGPPDDLLEGTVLFFVLLLSVIVTLMDRFRIVHYARFPERAGAEPLPAPGIPA